MKSATTVIFTLMLLANLSFGLSNKTINHYLASPDDHLGKNIKIYLSHAKPSTYDAVDNYVRCQGYSHYKGEHGGQIVIYIEKGQSKSFFKNVGMEPVSDGYRNGFSTLKTNSIRGVFSRYKSSGARGQYVLIIGGKLEDFENKNPEPFEINEEASVIFKVSNVGRQNVEENQSDLIRLFDLLNLERRRQNKDSFSRDELITRLKDGEEYKILTKCKKESCNYDFCEHKKEQKANNGKHLGNNKEKKHGKNKADIARETIVKIVY